MKVSLILEYKKLTKDIVACMYARGHTAGFRGYYIDVSGLRAY